jgi:hypothetical protein
MTRCGAVALVLLASTEVVCVPRGGRLLCGDAWSDGQVDDGRMGHQLDSGSTGSTRHPWGFGGDVRPDASERLLVPGPGGLICWPHGDHYHCRR